MCCVLCISYVRGGKQLEICVLKWALLCYISKEKRPNNDTVRSYNTYSLYIFSRQVFMSTPAVQAAFFFLSPMSLWKIKSRNIVSCMHFCCWVAHFNMCHNRAVHGFEIDPVAHFLVPTSSNFLPLRFRVQWKTRNVWTHKHIFDVDASSSRVFEGCYSTTIRLLRWWCWHNSFAAALSAEVRPVR